MHVDHHQKQEERKKQMDQHLRNKRDILEQREKDAENQSQTLARKMLNRKGMRPFSNRVRTSVQKTRMLADFYIPTL